MQAPKEIVLSYPDCNPKSTCLFTGPAS
jgi:hypothetical protein